MDADEIKSHFQRDSEVARFRSQSSYANREDYTQFSRRRVVASMLEEIEFATILDLGCGSGGYLPVIEEFDCHYYGFDVSEKMLQSAAEKAAEIGVTEQVSLINGDAQRLPFPPNSFDAILSVGLIEYFEDPSDIIEEAARVLKPGGKFLLHSYPRWPYFERLWFLVKPIKDYISGDSMTHHHRSKESIDSLMRSAGFSTIDWSASDFHVLPLPLDIVLFPLHVRLSEFISDYAPKSFAYFGVNYVGRYEFAESS